MRRRRRHDVHADRRVIDVADVGALEHGDTRILTKRPIASCPRPTSSATTASAPALQQAIGESTRRRSDVETTRCRRRRRRTHRARRPASRRHATRTAEAGPDDLDRLRTLRRAVRASSRGIPTRAHGPREHRVARTARESADPAPDELGVETACGSGSAASSPTALFGVACAQPVCAPTGFRASGRPLASSSLHATSADAVDSRHACASPGALIWTPDLLLDEPRRARDGCAPTGRRVHAPPSGCPSCATHRAWRGRARSSLPPTVLAYRRLRVRTTICGHVTVRGYWRAMSMLIPIKDVNPTDASRS